MSIGNAGSVSVGGTLDNNSGPLTVSGTFSSRGLLSVGRIANSNTTVILDGGILQAKGNQSSFVNGFTINGGGAFLDTAGFAVGVSGVSGTGALTVHGGGTLTLSGTNSYAGGTTLKAGTLTLTGTSTHAAGETRIGDTSGDNGTLMLTGGTISNSFGFLGMGTGSTGAATITNGTWTNSQTLFVGYYGNGTLQLNSGAVSAQNLIFGNGGTGNVTINGGTLSATTNLLVGSGGTGTLNINGGTVTSGGTSLIGSGSTGTVTSTGGIWNIGGDLLVGAGGNGTLSVGNGGVVNVTGEVISSPASSGGAITLSGTDGARGLLSATSLLKGGSVGSLTFEGGILRARADESNFLANYSSGDVTIGAGGAFIDSNGFAIGISTPLTGSGRLTKLGAGTLTLNAANTYGYDHGTIVKAGTLALATGGSITHVQGNFVAGDTIGDNGSLLINGGTLTSFQSFLGNAAGSTGSATVTSGTWSTGFELYVGNAGTGNLLVNGGNVSNGDAFVGDGGTGTGSATVSSGTWASNGGLTIGTGSLVISGGAVTNVAGVVGSLGTASASLTGGTWTNSGNLTIGSGNNGTLSVSAGMLQNAEGIVGSGAGGVGSATITGGTWTNTSHLSIGSEGARGTLLLNGGTITSATGLIFGSTSLATLTSGSWNAGNGFSVNAGTLNINGGSLVSRGGSISGSANVTGGSWNTNQGALTGDLNISAGSGATGRLTINGGTVTNNNSRVAFGGFQRGAVTVTSGTWNNLAGIFVAAAGGNGSVLVNGGTVNAASSAIGAGGDGSATITSGLWANSGDFIVGSNSTGSLTLSGVTGNRGVLQAARVREGTGAGTINIDGGVLRASGNQSDFLSGFEAGDVTIGAGGLFVDSNGHSIGIAHPLSGGALTKIGTGTVTLTGTNTSAGTIVKNGTLAVGTGGSITHHDIDAVIGENAGDNAALVVDGGTLANSQSYIGRDGATGSVTVNSGTWQTLSNTFVGYNGGHGTLTINGGVVSNSTAILGDDFAGGTGTAIVTGGTWNTGYVAELGDTFTVFTDGQSGRGWDAGNFTITTNLGDGLAWDTSRLASDGLLTVVPEPSTWILLAIGLLVVVGQFRKTKSGGSIPA